MFLQTTKTFPFVSDEYKKKHKETYELIPLLKRDSKKHWQMTYKEAQMHLANKRKSIALFDETLFKNCFNNCNNGLEKEKCLIEFGMSEKCVKKILGGYE